MSRTALALLSAAAFAAMPAAHADAADPRIAELLEQLGKTHAIREVALSPDGRQLAWTVQTAGKPVIQLADADGRHAHPLSAVGNCSQSDIAWAPDSRHLAFLSDCGAEGAEGKSKQLFVADLGGGAPAKVGKLEGYARALRWSPDGKQIAFLYVPGATRRASALAASKLPSGEIGVDGLEVQRIAEMDVAAGQLAELTPDGTYVYEFDWSPDGRRFAYTAAQPPGDNNWWIAKLYVQDAQAGAAPKEILDARQVQGPLHGLQIALPRWSPDNRQIAFIGGLMSDQGSTGGDIYAIAADGGSPADLTPDVHVTPAWLAWTGPDQLLVSQVANGQSQVAEYRLADGKASASRVLFTLPASIGNGTASMALSLSADHRLVAFTQSSFTEASEVHAGKLAAKAPPAVTAVNTALKPTWGKAESLEWEHEGRHVQGWLLYPAGYDPKKSYPMIVAVHGGPSAANMPRWPGAGFGGVPFSALGYFVFLPNPRGSFGQGEAYVQANRRDFGYGDLRDILSGIDVIEKKLPVDDQRLGLTGWSYGGFMTMFGVTQTHRFRAAVAGAGLANWQSYYGENLIDQWMTPFFGASVYDDPAVYAKSSAINYIKQVQTPTLVVVGDRDAECPAPQSFEFWHALRAQGVPTSLVVYPNEGHGFVKPEHQRDVLQRALGWFQKYLATAG